MSEIVDLVFVTDPASSTGRVLALGEGSPKVTPGNLGWTEISRPKQKGALEWEGRELIVQEIPILFDRAITGQSVQPEIDALQAIFRPASGPAPLVRISGPVNHTELTWAIVGFDFGDEAARVGGVLVQQSATLTLKEFEAADVVTVQLKPRKRTYKVKKGDRISAIAKKYLGNAKRWPEIVELNKSKIKNPKKLKAGITITLPAK